MCLLLLGKEELHIYGLVKLVGVLKLAIFWIIWCLCNIFVSNVCWVWFCGGIIFHGLYFSWVVFFLSPYMNFYGICLLILNCVLCFWVWYDGVLYLWWNLYCWCKDLLIWGVPWCCVVVLVYYVVASQLMGRGILSTQYYFELHILTN